MVRYVSMCLDCTALGLHCLGPGCRNRKVAIHCCDKCGAELPDDEIYDVDGEELCEDCLKEKFIRN